MESDVVSCHGDSHMDPSREEGNKKTLPAAEGFPAMRLHGKIVSRQQTAAMCRGPGRLLSGQTGGDTLAADGCRRAQPWQGSARPVRGWRALILRGLPCSRGPGCKQTAGFDPGLTRFTMSLFHGRARLRQFSAISGFRRPARMGISFCKNPRPACPARAKLQKPKQSQSHTGPQCVRLTFPRPAGGCQWIHQWIAGACPPATQWMDAASGHPSSLNYPTRKRGAPPPQC